MPRKARVLSESGYYHIMMRGLNGEWICAEQEEKAKLLSIIHQKIDDSVAALYGYCLMDNHVHLLLWCEGEHLAPLMKRINLTYAMYYNYKHQRRGPVFQDRFRSENIETEEYLLGALRYIHNNPVAAGLCQDATMYYWSSLTSYLHDNDSTFSKSASHLLKNYFRSTDEFINFHRADDLNLYLDTSETMAQSKKTLMKKLLEQICLNYQLENAKQIALHPFARLELVSLVEEHPWLKDSYLVQFVEVDVRTLYRWRELKNG